jgi:DNA-directed RNA polymerase specialized sigma54-like protein
MGIINFPFTPPQGPGGKMKIEPRKQNDTQATSQLKKDILNKLKDDPKFLSLSEEEQNDIMKLINKIYDEGQLTEILAELDTVSPGLDLASKIKTLIQQIQKREPQVPAQ